MEPVALTTEMIVVLAMLGLTVLLFVTEIFRIDFSAILIMVLLGLLAQIPGLGGLADASHLFDGFASNAVISIIAVMVIGAGLDRTGLMSKVAATILKYGGSTEKRIIPIISGTVGVISSFMQNVGAAALFLPVVSRISVRTEIPMSRLLMPMGFCAILGGTMTMVGSSPLILLNDLILTANRQLPAEQKMQTYDLFSVTPVGVCLVVTGILYFMLFGRWVLPSTAQRDEGASGQSVKEYLKRLYGLKTDLVEVIIPAGSPLQGVEFADLMFEANLTVIGSYHKGQKWFSPLVTTEIETPCRLALIGRRKVICAWAEANGVKVLPALDLFAEDYAATNAGISEIVVPPDSELIGQCAREIRMRGTYGINLLAIHRGGETLSLVKTDEHEATAIGLEPFRAGDTLVSFSKWDALARLTRDRNFVVVTSNFPMQELRPEKLLWALFFFVISVGMILFTDVKLSLCLFTGAAGMILTQVVRIDEAYEAVSWSTVFLLASLIPLGLAVQNTGTANWIAQQILTLLDGWPIWALQAGVAVLATVFTLVMSNVGATVLLVPLAVSIAVAAGADPAIFALTVAISTSNSFLIPTHQVNALIMGPGGYKVVDFVKSGGVMTLLFLVVSLVMMNVVFG
ncbi:SLC13 family permease [Pseudoruegeria sp. SHC-113]|uniref:SLC13 family permease n=1 Tax=Pseudoruegeria sp. SHC-113 TaxID=2855439 RepID=UPI0021BB9433|nr:SLC13 family permease [Pseudoruegeria sp. SHC-113]MCT8160277.1 SLC13 family permease [Pseudoruegeria sp. SHC-113]